ncbi:G-patch 2 domain containing protein [Pyrenophora tritici-repentis]|nr:G-patch-2 domain-containing protein [Pyrenophora tritici-repentis]KAF7452059.1 G-patch 2 domain containing protein [Pyrenophora tritici-repentis]KAG9386410.1 G-patch 2 domain containing protein [Pyrenophora tritici-repentis]KAI0605306.1 G-patch-2 domain-containing protein [Pyrenophora tritici-repentis]KAI0617904.1 G-patch-2 domain-containing protein [Pyrenophora tritici-repentis]
MAAPKQGGFKMSLGALKAKPGLKALPAQKDVKKSKLMLGDDEPDDSNKQQEIIGWDAAEGGALDANTKKEKEQPRVIPALPNRDRREEARRKQLAKAPHTQAQKGDVDEKQMEGLKIQYGLTIVKKDETQDDGAAEAPGPEPMEVDKDELTEEQRLEKKALDALINGKSAADELVIPAQTEEEEYINDIHNAPDGPTLEAYEATPIEGFGAALLRGMGWKGEETTGNSTKSKEVKRRPALLGVGAKADAAVGVELGEWGVSKGKGKKMMQDYNPVALRNKKTGETITEEELKAKLENQNLLKERVRGDDYDGERRREKRRDRSRSPDDRKEKRRDRYRSRSRGSDDQRKRRRDREYDDVDRHERKRHRDDKYYK